MFAMRIKKILTTFLVVALVGVLAGCQQNSVKKEGQATNQKSVTLVNKPLTQFNDLKGKVYLYTQSYVGKPVKNLNNVNWENRKVINSFAFIDNKTAFVGSYNKDGLLYGRTYTIKKDKNNFFTFKQTKFTVAQDKYKTYTPSVQGNYKSADNSQIPDAIDGEQYYVSKTHNVSSTKAKYRFYKLDKKTFVRENPPKGNVRYYAKNVLKQ